MLIVKLGFRNLFRHKKRTLITAAIISLAILIYLGVIITSLTCIYPARRAARLEPTQALRER